MAEQFTQIPISFLTHLLNVRREHLKVCTTHFKMAEEDIGKDWTGDAINERIAQLTTAYSLRKNVAERESGAAFRKPIIPPLTTPGIEDSETS